MDFRKQYEQAKKSGYLKPRSATFHKWDAPGEVIIGKFISYKTVASGTSEGEFNIYLFDTEQGSVKFTLGSVTDSEVEKIFVEGLTYAIEYLGQEDITGGRRVNRFDIFEVTAALDKERAAKGGVVSE